MIPCVNFSRRVSGNSLKFPLAIKYSNTNTFQAFKEIKTLILQNKTTSNLRVFLSVLTENRNKHLESEINIIGFIVEKYGTGLLDPLDKQPSIEKTTFRVTEMLLKCFSDSQTNVQLACQKAWVQIYLSVLIS